MARRIVGLLLIAFVGASLAWLGIKQFRRPAAATPQAESTPLAADRVEVIYFHGKERCPTCVTIEKWSREAVEQAFAAELADGRVRWRVLDFESPENEPLRNKYKLIAASVVVVRVHGQDETDWKKVSEVWDKVLDNDKPGLFKAVQAAVRGHAEEEMIQGYLLGALTALLLGLQMAVSPCPMATNVAAMTFLGRHVGGSAQVLLAGLLYAAGRAVAYVGVAVVILGSLAADTQVTAFLRGTINTLLGLVLIVAAMFLLGVIRWAGGDIGWVQHLQKRTERWGIWSSLLLGMAFALAFCPLSAALFFSLIPIAARCGSTIGFPAIFGVATALPVVVFAAIIAYSAKSVGKAFNRMEQIERWLRRIAGAAFLLAGLYFTLVYIWDVPIPLPNLFPGG